MRRSRRYANAACRSWSPTRALVATRMLLEESEHATYAAQFRREIEVQSEVRQSADALEGRAAFVEKRKASFSGR
jgi:2-(1,2-epoxy-1,2-dihydrophenyl)acetyl-CoA isomerase